MIPQLRPLRKASVNDKPTGAVRMEAGKAPDERSRPGPIYDTALRWLSSASLRSVVSWLGVDSEDDPVMLSESLPASVMQTDLLVQVSPDRLVHVEFVRRVDADLPGRMLEYRARIMRHRPGVQLSQHLLILAEGQLPNLLGDQHHAFWLDVIYLREREAKEFLDSPALAPLAVLARAEGPRERIEHLRAAVRVIEAAGLESHRQDGLREVARTLAKIHLPGTSIVEGRKEIAMPLSEIFSPEEERRLSDEWVDAWRNALIGDVTADALAQGRDPEVACDWAFTMFRRFRARMTFAQLVDVSVALAALPLTEAAVLIYGNDSFDQLLQQVERD